MSLLTIVLPVLGQPDLTEDPKINTAFTTIQTWANGNIDASNMTAAAAQALGGNQAGQVVKGASIVATSQARTNTAYGTLATPDQVASIVLATNGLIKVWYQATWQESVSGTARAAIFLGATQLHVAQSNASVTTAAATAATTDVNIASALFTTAQYGLASINDSGNLGISYTGDVTTGQVIGSGSGVAVELNGTVSGVTVSGGGSTSIFANAGTYTISVQFKSSSGTVTVSNRRLYVQAISFT